MMRKNYIRSGILLVTFVLTSVDFFRAFALIWQNHFSVEHLVLTIAELATAVICGAFTTHALLSLWQGTAFAKDMVDYGPMN